MRNEEKYKQICEKLGFDPATYRADISDTEDDNWENPFYILSTEEIMFLYNGKYMH